MARIPDEEIERLKREVALERLAAGDGVELRRHGADLIGRCPFHDDKTPSLVITPSKNLWHCLGACQQGGSVIDWVMKARSVSFRHAVEILRGDVLPVRRGRLAVLPGPVVPSAEDPELLSQVVAYYHETLKESPEALEYLEKRGIRNDEAIQRFKLGYANRTLGYRLSSPKVRERLERLGVIRQSGHEHFNGSLVVPILDEHGHVLGMYGRKITPSFKLRKGTPLHLYLPGPHRGVFNVAALGASRTVILCESLIDALSFWCAGYRNVTASYGVEGFTAAHLNSFRRNRTGRVLIAYDRDEAGDRAAASLAAKLMDEGMECLRVQFPHGMDANEYACKVKPAEKSLGVLLTSAVWIGKPRKPMAHPDPEPEADPPAPKPDDEGAGPPEDLPLTKLFSWRDRELTKPVPRRSSAAAPDGALNEPEPAEHPSGSATDELETPAVESVLPEEPEGPHAHVGTVSSPYLAAVAAKEVVEAMNSQEGDVAAEGVPEPAPAAADPDPTYDDARDEPASSVTPEADMAPTAAGKAAHEERLVFEDRHYRVRGLEKNLAYDLLRVNVLAARGEAMHVDTLDLYSARQRAVFVKQAAIELRLPEELIKRDLGRVIRYLEERQEERIKKALEPKTKDIEMTPEERDKALGLLRDPRLLERIVEDFDACGVVGEETNKLLGYLAAVSRKLEEPLAVIVQSSSSAGKSSLMEAVLAFVPEEDRVKYSAMTGQSLFYLGETDLEHKVLAIAEERGAERATYALKLLQSEGELTIASTGKDPATGRLVTQEYRVCGPVMIFLTTTAVEVDEELLNRCLVLTVDEDREQTRRVHRLQREHQTLGGLLARQERAEIVKLHRNAQRLIRPLLVVNPYAPRLTFLDDKTRTRRDHMKYLTLIRTIALLHQHQRETKTVEHRGKVVAYVEATLEDIATANLLAHQVLGRSLDELAPQTRRLLMLLEQMVGEACERERSSRRDFHFSRRAVREYTGWSHAQVHVHMARLLEYEYVLAHRGGRGQSYEYELVYSGQGKGGEPFLAGLIAVEALGAGAPTAGTVRASRAGIGAPFAPNSGPFLGDVEAQNSAPSLEETFKSVLERQDARPGNGSSRERRTSGNGHTPAGVLSALVEDRP